MTAPASFAHMGNHDSRCALSTVAKGNTVATGRADDRTDTGGGFICSFDFTVSGVPAREDVYTVVVEGQGGMVVSAAGLTSGKTVLVSYKLFDSP